MSLETGEFYSRMFRLEDQVVILKNQVDTLKDQVGILKDQVSILATSVAQCFEAQSNNHKAAMSILNTIVTDVNKYTRAKAVGLAVLVSVLVWLVIKAIS